MIIDEHRQWLINFYKQREWYQYSPFIRLNFLMEEVGELPQTVRANEVGRDHPGETAQKSINWTIFNKSIIILIIILYP